MFLDLMWIVGCYAAAAVWVHWIVRRSGGASRRRYVLVAGNHQMQIEWYVRALRRFSLKTGTPLDIAVLLDRSDDETGRIVETFVRNEPGIALFRKEERSGVSPHEEWERYQGAGFAEWLELRNAEDVAKLPL